MGDSSAAPAPDKDLDDLHRESEALLRYARRLRLDWTDFDDGEEPLIDLRSRVQSEEDELERAG